MDLTFLQSIPAHVFGIALGVVGVLLVSLICWRMTVISRRVEVYRAALGKFWKAVSASEAVYKQLTGDPAGLVFQAPAFSGKTKTEYERERVSWLNWINWRALAEERRDRAEVSYRKHCNRGWTQCFGKRHLEAAIDALLGEPISGVGQSLPANLGALTASLPSVQGDGAALPGLIADRLSAVTSSFQRFTKIVADAAATRRNIDSEFTNTIADDRAGIEYLCSQLLQSGLALSPYDQRLTELRSTRDELLALLTSDPIGVGEQATTAHMQKIGMLRRSFLDAIKYKRNLEALRGRHLSISTEAGKMFDRPPVSVIATVQFSSNFSFSEPKFELKPALSECGDGIQELETLLLEGHLIKFGRALEKVDKDVAYVERLFAKIVEDKGRVDEIYSRILTLSNQTDSAHDEPELSELRTLYSAQKWNASVKVVEALLTRCQGRARVRQHYSVLEQHQVRLTGRIHDLAAVVSAQLDEVLAERQAQCALLRVRAQSPDADVEALIADIDALTEKLVGEKPESLEALLRSRTGSATASQVGAARPRRANDRRYG